MASTTYSIFPTEGFTAVQFITSANLDKSADFYSRILGGTVVRDTIPRVVQLANTWIVINEGGGPTDDKPDVHLAPPANPNMVSSFLELRVANIQEFYNLWKGRGAEFLTEPKEHDFEWRCYMKDPDGYIIEVGQAKQSGF